MNIFLIVYYTPYNEQQPMYITNVHIMFMCTSHVLYWNMTLFIVRNCIWNPWCRIVYENSCSITMFLEISQVDDLEGEQDNLVLDYSVNSY